MVVHACNPSTWDAQSLPVLHTYIKSLSGKQKVLMLLPSYRSRAVSVPNHTKPVESWYITLTSMSLSPSEVVSDFTSRACSVR